MKTLLAGALALVLGACTLQTGGPEGAASIVVRSFPEAVELGRYPLERKTFALSFIHSVSETPVRDEYRVEGGHIVQTAETFETHGAGLPSGFDEVGATGWEQRDGRFVLLLERSIPHLVVRTDRRYENRLHIGSDRINLNQWPDQALEITVTESR